jgi:hypothetical protein
MTAASDVEPSEDFSLCYRHSSRLDPNNAVIRGSSS